jgi:hypothetical protein
MRFFTTSISVDTNNNNYVVVGAYATSTAYQVVAVLRTLGTYFFIKGGAFTNWTLLYIASLSGQATMYTIITAEDSSSVFTVDYCRIPDVLWLPTPAAYDTFTAANGTDLNGRASDTTGPDSQAVVARTWTAQTGSWDIQSNRANTTGVAPPSPAFFATMLTTDADIVISSVVNLGAAAAWAAVVVRYTDDDNCWRIVAVDATNIFIIQERNAGVATTRATTAIAVAASTDYDFQIVTEGQNITAYLDNANRITYGSAALNETAVTHGISCQDAAARFDNFTVFPRGTGGEYSKLSSY